MMQNSGPTGSSGRAASQGRICVHADLAASAALAASDEERTASGVEIVLGGRERFVNAQAAAPEHDDQRAQSPPVPVLAGEAHDRDDLLDRRRVGGVAHALVPWRSPV
jgi:hypothetical protein